MIIIDDFIQDESLLQELQHNDDFYTQGFSWWNGWWNTPAQSLRHRLIEYIWKDNTPHQYSGIYIAGFEHWTGTYDGADQSHKYDESRVGIPGIFSLAHHMDKDEHLYNTTREIVTPAVGTIFYPRDHVHTGGYLRIYNSKFMEGCKDNYELIAPKFNRLIIFDPSYIHAVEEVTSGVRQAIAINLWTELPSEGQMKDMNEII
jgi:hypothetical protein